PFQALPLRGGIGRTQSGHFAARRRASSGRDISEPSPRSRASPRLFPVLAGRAASRFCTASSPESIDVPLFRHAAVNHFCELGFDRSAASLAAAGRSPARGGREAYKRFVPLP